MNDHLSTLVKQADTLNRRINKDYRYTLTEEFGDLSDERQRDFWSRLDQDEFDLDNIRAEIETLKG